MYKVVTNNGITFTGAFSNVGAKKDAAPTDKDACESMARLANGQAESLGIATRYEVVEA